MHLRGQPESFRGKKRSGCYLTTLFGNVEITTAAVPADEAQSSRRKHGLLPVLTVLFCISYGLMTMLIVEQGRTIDSQRALIRELFRDSMALNATRLKALHDQRAAKQSQAAKAPSNTPSTQAPSNNTLSNNAPSAQVQSQTPSSQAAPQRRSQSQKIMPKQFDRSLPASDQAQDRHALIRI